MNLVGRASALPAFLDGETMKNRIFAMLVAALVCVMILGIIMIYQGLHAYKVVDSYYEEATQYVVTTVESTPSPAAPSPGPVGESVEEPESILEEASVVEEPLEKPPIAIDFETLLGDSPDTVGWLYAPDGTVNLPVVQGTDNLYYLTHLPNGEYSSGGSLFLDYLNSRDFEDEVSFIFGHNMKNGTMLQPLLEYRQQSYYDANPVLYLLTPGHNYKLELFAGILTGIESDVYTFNFDGPESKQTFINGLVAQSTFVPLRIPEASERILCLSTCAYDYENARYVVFGALTEIG